MDEQYYPEVSGSPTAIWLQYGDIEADCTHAECCANSDVTWCDEPVFNCDVKYVRADLLRSVMESDAGRAVLNSISRGQGTETESGKAWLAAAAAIGMKL